MMHSIVQKIESMIKQLIYTERTMTESNKGRFKCKNEAQAVWNFLIDYHSKSGLKQLIENSVSTEAVDSYSILDSAANALHKARLIHGSIYDEHGRIEDKDVAFDIAKVVYTDFDFFEFDDSELEQAISFILNSKEFLNIRKTIFY